MNYLDRELQIYCRGDVYPFHMPGHKRRMGEPGAAFSEDITEIHGFDNLHHPEGILLEAQNRAARLYGSRHTFYLVNGSTCGILAAVFASTTQNGKILMARNCHKSVYHGVQLRGLEAAYVYPEQTEYQSILGPISPDSVRRSLEEDSSIQAVLITSPTYDGVVSDVKRIGEIVHEFGLPLIVDEAHGAHFGFHPYFPDSSVNQGADLVIHSLHKTLPSLTQTALLHVNGDLVRPDQVGKYLGIFETSSPSYVLMASMEQCIRILDQEGEKLFKRFVCRLEGLFKQAERWKSMGILRLPSWDPSKIIITAKGKGGTWIGEALRNRFHLEPEMVARDYVLALTSIGDTDEGFQRLGAALSQMDCELEINPGEEKPWESREVYPRPETCLTIGEALERKGEKTALKECAGRISREYAYLYPPGIPLVAPGEKITSAICDLLLNCKREGLALQGLSDYSGETLEVCG